MRLPLSFSPSLLLISLLPVVLSAETTLNVYHRVVTPYETASPGTFSLRGTVTLDPGSGSDAASSPDAGYLSAGDNLNLEGLDIKDAMYHVALERPGVPQDKWSFTSTKAVCQPHHLL